MSDDATPGPTPFDDVPADKQPKAGQSEYGQSEYGQSEYGQSDGTAGSTGPDQFGTAAQGPAETVERPRESFPPPPPETQAAPPRHVMVSDPAADPAADPATDAAGWGGGNDLPPPVEGSGTDFPTHRTKAGTTAAIIALGTGLLGAAAIITATRARADGELD
ncbi:MAG: hypothetical protein L0H31_15495, partial [Nocardioidaceae bacterium]|nr:hypothetical protein [Nocardioidaceae bacterium]